jgi:hydroxymethylpyrimidine/phosphomethylpyrimidine kinase
VNLPNQNKILIIAGSDPCSGAGIQADLKVATLHQVYASAVPACLTAQNTKKVYEIFYPPIKFLQKQIEVLFDDIKFDVIKIGMLGSADIIDCVADILSKKDIPIILDTIILSGSGDLLLEKNALEALKSRLVSKAFLVTPNIYEAEILAEIKIKNISDMKLAAIKIKALGAKNILIKGAHLDAINNKITHILLDENNNFFTISNTRIKIQNVRGTGCALASAIACNVANKIDLISSIKKANQFVQRKIKHSIKIGNGSNIIISILKPYLLLQSASLFCFLLLHVC